MEPRVMKHVHRTGLRRRVAIAGVAVVALAAGCASGSGTQATPIPRNPTSSTVAGASAAGSTVAPSSPTTSGVAAAAYAPGRHVVSFVVNGGKRVAVVVVPQSQAKPAPLVFVFHGHGGTGPNIERKFDIESLWRAAIVVYPNGLVGHAGKTDPQGVKSGWQTELGESGNRDLAFYDAMLATLQAKLPVDTHRVYAIGHSNGSGFVSLLLNQRGSGITATANLSSQPSARVLSGDPTRSMFMAMGITDPIVPYANQKRAIPLAEHKLGVDPQSGTVHGFLRSETGPHGLELDVYIYPGGHSPPAEVPKLVVEFFRRHALDAG
jgi:polyhydroxybutyrate depolymerase